MAKPEIVMGTARTVALDKAMQTLNQPTYPYGMQGMSMPTPKTTPDEVIATAQKFLGFLLMDKKTIQPRAKR